MTWRNLIRLPRGSDTARGNWWALRLRLTEENITSSVLFVAANTRMATAIQILCVIACRAEQGANSEIISRSLRTNPVVVRRMLKCLQQQGLVDIRPGKDGGVALLRSPDEITLDAIYQAVEADGGVFMLRPRGNPNCPVDRRMKDLLSPVFAATDTAVVKTLRQTTLGSLARAIP